MIEFVSQHMKEYLGYPVEITELSVYAGDCIQFKMTGVRQVITPAIQQKFDEVCYNAKREIPRVYGDN